MLHRALAPSSGPPDTALFGPQVPLAQLANPLANGPRGGSRCPCHRCLPAPAYRPYLSSKEPPPHPLVHSGRKRPVPASDGIFIDHLLSIPSKLKIVKLICDDYLGHTGHWRWLPGTVLQSAFGRYLPELLQPLTLAPRRPRRYPDSGRLPWGIVLTGRTGGLPKFP